MHYHLIFTNVYIVYDAIRFSNELALKSNLLGVRRFTSLLRVIHTLYSFLEVPVKHGCQNLYDKDTSILDLHTKRAQVDPDKRYYDRGDRVTLKCEKNYRLEFGNDDAYRVYCHGFTDQTAEWTTLSWPGCARMYTVVLNLPVYQRWMQEVVWKCLWRREFS